MAILAFTTVLLALAASARDPQAVGVASPDPRIESVVTAASPDGAGFEGRYRVVLWTQGFEHVTSGVMVEWIAPPREDGARAGILHSEVLVAPGFHVFRAPRLIRTEQGYDVLLEGTDTYAPYGRVSCRFALLPEGRVRVVRPCS